MLENWALEAISATGKAFPRTIPALSRLAAAARHGRHDDRPQRPVFVNERRVRFTEMEYAVPREHGPEAARRVIEWVRSNRYPVFFPIEMRVAAGDDALLSPAHERDTAYIAVHQYRGMEWRPYFEAVEAIMDELRRPPPLGQAPLPDRGDPGAALPALGAVPGGPRRARPRAASSPTSTPPASSAPEPSADGPISHPGGGFQARRRLEERFALAAVGRDDVDDLVAFDQVEDVEALAELARLGVAHVDAVADREVRRPAGPSSGVWTSPAPSSGSSFRPGGSQGDGRRAASPRPEAR